MNGNPCGNEELDPLAVFRNEKGFTTLAVAVAMLVTLALVFAIANVSWNKSLSGDVQAVADSTALAGANVVAKYMTVATVLDACVLSLGLVGMSVMALGVVVAAIPPLSKFAAPVLDAGKTVLRARSDFARSAYQGLAKLEKGLPYLSAANSILAVEANGSGRVDYTGVAVPFPYDGTDGSFASYDDLLQEAGDMQDSSSKVKEYSDAAEVEKKLADEAKRAGWLADCGGQPYSMYQRAQTLAGMDGAINPYYPNPEEWTFGVALLRARGYYATRLAQEAPEGPSLEEQVDSVARTKFYEVALERVNAGLVVEHSDGTVDLDLPELPKNTSDMCATHVYTESVWPVSLEGHSDKDEGSYVLHYSTSCPGMTGPYAGSASLADIDSGHVHLCPLCRFNIADIGKVPQASTSIENGFEHHWKRVVEASKEYEGHKNEQIRLENEAKKAAEKSASAFEAALAKLAAPRPKLTPPGRYGCVAVVCDSETHEAPSVLSNAFVPGSRVPARAAVSAAALAPDEATKDNNVLSQFFDNLKGSGGFVSSGVGWLLDGIFEVWGSILLSYGNGFDALGAQLNRLFDKAGTFGFGRVATWIKEKLGSVVDLMGFRPADLRLKKPVLVNSVDVFDRAGVDGAVRVRRFINALPSKAAMKDPGQFAGVLADMSQDVFGTTEFEIAVLKIPGTEIEIPITVDLWEVAQG